MVDSHHWFPIEKAWCYQSSKVNTKQTIHQFYLSIMWNKFACACLWTHKWIKKVKFSICNAIKRSTWYICCSKWWKWNGIKYYNHERAIHEVSSEEEPTSPLPTKRTAPGPLASGQDGTFVPKGAGRGGPSKISSFCPNLPRSGQGSSGRDRSSIRLPEGTKPSVPPKPGNQSKSKDDKNSPY